jgi:hypothetical protein
MNFLQRIPVTTTFADRSAEASHVVASGPCGSSNPNLRRTSRITTGFDETDNAAIMNVNGQGLGCVNSFLNIHTNNTEGFCHAAGFFFYTIAQREVENGLSCSISASARLSGMTHNLVLPTTNEGNIFLSEDDKEVFSRCYIDCRFEVFDGEQSILASSERILEQEFSGATDVQDATNSFFTFNNQERPIQTLYFTPSGDNDVILKITLVFVGSGKGMFNGCSVGANVPFDPPHRPNGFLSTRVDFAITKPIDYAKMFELIDNNHSWLDDLRIRVPIS